MSYKISCISNSFLFCSEYFIKSIKKLDSVDDYTNEADVPTGTDQSSCQICHTCILTVFILQIFQVTILSLNTWSGGHGFFSCIAYNRRISKIPKGQTKIVKSEDRQDQANKMKWKTNIENTTLKIKYITQLPNKSKSIRHTAK